MPYLTPASLPDTTTCRQLVIPDDTEFIGIVTGALLNLTRPYMFELSGPSSLTPQETADAFKAMFFEYRDIGAICMIGAIIPSFLDLPAPKFLPCNGDTYGTVDYPKLGALMEAAGFSLMSGSFYVPDLSRQVLAQYDPTYEGMLGDPHNWGNLNDYIGEADHVLTEGELPIHDHSIAHTHTTDPHTHTDIPALPNATTIGPGAPQPTAIPGVGTTGIGGGGSTSGSSAGYSGQIGNEDPHNTVQPTFLCRYFVVAN